MADFKDREKAFEAKFALDEEMQFKAAARRNKLLGLWAAEHMGITGPDADAYAKAVIVADFEEKGDDDVFRKVSKDLAEHGTPISDTEIRAKMTELLTEAKATLLSEAD